MEAPKKRPHSGTTEPERAVRRILSDAIRRSSKNRQQIAEAMANELGRPITASMLGDFTRNSNLRRNVRFPAAWVPAFCRAAGSDGLQRYLLSEELLAALELGEWDMRHLKRGGNGSKIRSTP